MLTATAAMLAEAFRQPGERMPLFGLGLIGLVGAAISSIMLWDTDARSFGVVRADNFAPLHQPDPLRRRRPDDAVFDRGGGAGRAAAG